MHSIDKLNVVINCKIVFFSFVSNFSAHNAILFYALLFLTFNHYSQLFIGS